MANAFQQVMDKISLNPTRLFLVDGAGAVLSAFMLGIVLVKLEPIIGMPQEVLFYLALPACFFIVYSFSCYFLTKENWRPFLKFIAIANLIYCLVSICIVIQLYSELTALGVFYFLVEIAIVVFLSSIELKTAST